MKRFLIILTVIFSFNNLFAQQIDIPNTLIQSLLKIAVNDTLSMGPYFGKLPKTVPIVDYFYRWDSLSFNFPLERLPKTKEEREKMLNAEYEPYNEYYAFSFFITDTIFSEDDKKYILLQLENANTYRRFSYNSKNIRLVKDSVRDIKHNKVCYLAYTFPVFSKDLKFAIIRRYQISDWFDSIYKYFGVWQTLYYKNDPQKGWERIYAGSIINVI